MAKVLELESGVDPIPTEAEQDKMTDTEKVIQSLMRKSYTLGCPVWYSYYVCYCAITVEPDKENESSETVESFEADVYEEY